MYLIELLLLGLVGLRLLPFVIGSEELLSKTRCHRDGDEAVLTLYNRLLSGISCKIRIKIQVVIPIFNELIACENLETTSIAEMVAWSTSLI